MEGEMKAKETGMIFTILAKKEADVVVAHCLELDIVATGNTVKEVKKEMEGLILTQVDYAFSNDNIDNLYHPAPAEVWEAFYKCKKQTEKRLRLKSEFKKKKAPFFVPPVIITKTCFIPNNLCRA
jgi:hypothetical protein